jgi:serine/threonine protein kinase
MPEILQVDLNTFADALKTARRARGLSQREGAKKLGIAPLVLSKLERAELRPEPSLLATVVREFGVFGQNDANAKVVIASDDAGETRAHVARLPDADSETRVDTQVRAHVPTHREDTFVGRNLRGYEFIEKIGEGGFGAVYRARQLSVGRDVAIKVVRPEFADDAEFIRRFEAEAQLVARLEHPHIVPLYDFWRQPGAAFMVMRLLKRGSLSQYLSVHDRVVAQPGNFEQAASLRLLPILHQVAQALSAAHRAGVVHRDFKPANILLDEGGNACLADFGVAKQLNDDSGRTGLGEVVGSLAYCAPEQLRGELVSAATDVYALGLVAFELIAGRRPFASMQAANIVAQHLHEKPPNLSEFVADLPEAINSVVARALEKDAAARPQDALSFVNELEAAFRGSEASWLGGAGLAIGEFSSATANTLMQFQDLDSPYLGLASFDEGDARNFFGREGLVEEIIDKLSARPAADRRPANAVVMPRALMVVGASGSGKSSVVRAGLIPALRLGAIAGSKKWFITTLVPGQYPFASLIAALQRVAVREFDLGAMLSRDSFGLSHAIDRCLPNEPDCELLLVVDQFEELFTLCLDEVQRRAWIAAITTALMDANSRLRVVFTLRADFLDKPLQYPDLAEIARERMVLVPAMSLDELERAIVGPARRIGLMFEAGLVAAILDEVRDQLGALPLLQYALSELFLRRKDRELKLSAFRAMGGVRGALAGRAESAFASLDTAAQDATRQLFLRLTTLGEGSEDTRRRAYQSEIVALQKTPEALGANAAAIAEFAKARLLTFDRDSASHEPTIEVAHEALLRNWLRLRGWLTASRADLRLQRQLSDAGHLWRNNAQDQSFLLAGNRLAQFRPLLLQMDVALTEAEALFLHQSIRAQDQLDRAESERQQRELQQAHELAEQQMAAAKLAKASAAMQKRGNTRLRWLIAGLAAILAFAFWQAHQLSKRSQALAMETARANVEAKSAGALSEFWQDLFATSDPNRSKGKDLSVRDVLDVGVTQLGSKLTDAPIARATLLLTIAKTYRQLSAMESAKAAIEQASSVLASQTLAGVDARKLSVEVLLERARIFADAKDSAAALLALAKAKTLQEKMSATPLERAVTLNIWASVLIDQGEIASAITLLEQTLALRQGNAGSSTEIAATMNNLAFSMAKVDRLNDAKRMFAKAYALRGEALGEQNIDTALTRLNLGRTERDLGHFAEADNAFNHFFATFKGLFPDVATPHPAMIDALVDLGISLRMQGRASDAMGIFDRAVAMAAISSAGTPRIGLFRERAITLMVLQRYPEAKLDTDVCLMKTEASFGRTNPAYARCLWLAAKIAYFLAKSRQDNSAGHLVCGIACTRLGNPPAMLHEALAVFESANHAFRLDYAQALLFQAELIPTQTVTAKSKARELLAPVQEYWLAQQLLTQIKR